MNLKGNHPFLAVIQWWLHRFVLSGGAGRMALIWPLCCVDVVYLCACVRLCMWRNGWRQDNDVEERENETLCVNDSFHVKWAEWILIPLEWMRISHHSLNHLISLTTRWWLWNHFQLDCAVLFHQCGQNQVTCLSFHQIFFWTLDSSPGFHLTPTFCTHCRFPCRLLLQRKKHVLVAFRSLWAPEDCAGLQCSWQRKRTLK